ncbi:hypothetical protein M758_2G072900 [Ceratodon purpureus]|nr:hypothetical protein M758_2G072900 [Ceratodon purpureus]
MGTESTDGPQLTPLTTASANAPTGPDLTPVYPSNPATPEYARAQAAFSSQSAPSSVNTGRISALETAVSKISHQVCNNETSLKQVLEGQNFMAQLLMRYLNSDTNQGNVSHIPSTVQSMHNVHGASIPTPLHAGVSTPASVDPPRDIPGQDMLKSLGLKTRNHEDSSRPPRVASEVNCSPACVDRDTITVSQVLAPPVPQPVNVVRHDGYEDSESPPSWMSGSTILITPSMNIRRPDDLHPRSSGAMSTDISDSIRTPSVAEDPLQPFLDVYAGPDTSWRASRENGQSRSSPSGCSPAAPPTFTEAPRVQTRQQVNVDTDDDTRRERQVERIRHGLMIMPRITDDPVACNKPCYILHPDLPDVVVADGKTGGSWKAKTLKFGHLCNKGEQMVQVHQIRVPKCRLLHVEEKQAFSTLDDALVKSRGSNVFIKWSSKHLVRIVEK